MHFARVSSLVLFAFAMSACSSSSSGSNGSPVIDDLDIPTTATVGTIQTSSGSQQAYVLRGTLNFHDDTENVNSFSTHVTSPANVVQDSHVTFPTPPGPINKGPLQLTLALPPGGPFVAGTTIDYQISVTSVSGKISEPISKTVTLQ
ncbi:MAG: hypothetical protein ABI461_03830 [Polyangiaceae bacterium]